MSGNPVVNGLGGSVHTNGNLGVSGNPSIGGDLTSSGALSESGNITVGGSKASGVPAVDIPAIDPRTVWSRHAGSPLYAGHWWDLCPDASVRLPDGAAPCAGTVVAANATSTAFRGWRLSGSSWTVSGNDGSFHGIYYAHRRGIRVSGNPGFIGTPWMVTLISEAEQTGTSGGCPILGSGDIDISGNPRLTGFLEGLALMAGRDLQVSGNPTQSLSGVMAAHEQFNLSGNPTLVGAVIGESACDTSASQYHVSTVEREHDAHLQPGPGDPGRRRRPHHALARALDGRAPTRRARRWGGPFFGEAHIRRLLTSAVDPCSRPPRTASALVDVLRHREQVVAADLPGHLGVGVPHVDVRGRKQLVVAAAADDEPAVALDDLGHQRSPLLTGPVGHLMIAPSSKERTGGPEPRPALRAARGRSGRPAHRG